MPEDTGTSQLINQLTNPPNPMAQFGQTINTANALKQFQADKAISDIYGQSIDPNTGQVDLGKFNALASQNPAALWKFGAQMQQAGTGVQAQGLGTAAQLQAAQDQLGAQAAYLQPLMQKILNGQSVTGAEVSAALASMPPGLVPASSVANIQRQLAQVGPDGDASGIVRGAAFANAQGQTILKSGMPSYDTQNTGSQIITRNLAPPGLSSVPAPAPLTTTLTPSERLGQQNWLTVPVQGGYYDKNGQFKEGSRLQWLQDYGINPNDVRIAPDGSASAPGIPGFQSGARQPSQASPTPQLPPVQPPAAPSQAPSKAPIPGPSATSTTPATTPTPQPPGPGQPKNINQPTQPAAGGTPAMSPTQVGAGEQAYQAAVADMPNSQARRTTIALALQALPGAAVGGGTDTMRAIRNVLGTYTPEYIQKIIPDYDPAKAATDDQLATKYMQQITNASIPGGQGTNEKLQAAAQATPNPHMQEQASRDVLQVMDAGELLKQHVLKEFQATGQPPAKFAQWSANWATTHDPRAFMLPFMTPDQLKYLQNTITQPAAKKAFNNTVHELVTSGTIPDPTKTPGMTE